MRDLTYVVPLRSSVPPSEEFTAYLTGLAEVVSVVVVDSSDDDVFAADAAAFGAAVDHRRPDPRHRCANGKVHNVLTALDHVRTPWFVIADDDVRYTPELLEALGERMLGADLVVPQNVFVGDAGLRLPWHVHWDTARTLLNRVTGGDFPGTLAVRTELLRSTGGYDGDVLFENLELIRTIDAAGGLVRRADDLYVPRRPPVTAHFAGQRVRQAYDEFARPRRLCWQLAIAPVVAASLLRSRAALAVAAGAAMLAAEIGRRRRGGARHFSPIASLFAPLWIVERGLCAWLALVARWRGGVTYAGGRLRAAANSTSEIRRQLSTR